VSSETSSWLTRFFFLRLLGLVYAFGFLCIVYQARPLIGQNGLEPAKQYLDAVAASHASRAGAFLELPTLFWLDASDDALAGAGWIGLVLSLVLLAGFANSLLLFLLWALYLSFVNIGQLFWGYGWETLLLETGFLACFAVPLLRGGPFPAATPMPASVVWLLRWLLFRMMFGAGLIKLRSDPCWRDLTCMLQHYETQPLPGPLSYYFHHLPAWFHQLETLFNHFVEIVVPWAIFAPRRVRAIGGVLLVVFQVLLILSGNLAFLNWLTIALCVSCFDDRWLGRLAPQYLRSRVGALGTPELRKPHALAVGALVVVVALLSLNPVGNMLSPRQVMNMSYDPLHLVNSYGMFGSMVRERHEIVLEGTLDADPGETARWVPYEFKCKPGDVFRRPCQAAPYQYKIDWQMWFAAMSDPRSEPWLITVVLKLLEGDRDALGLLAADPFAGQRPRFVRARFYLYQFVPKNMQTRAWWRRTELGEYLPPLSVDAFVRRSR
jgi:hypothetical protein